ncbi:MAG: hypothetical protein LC754_11960 [Acidobacteria bacterium]|nr:hypothetical protein [Acidobacteriota bacterium]
MTKTILIKGGTLVTMDARNSVVVGDLLIHDGRIAAVGGTGATADVTIDAAGCAVRATRTKRFASSKRRAFVPRSASA